MFGGFVATDTVGEPLLHTEPPKTNQQAALIATEEERFKERQIWPRSIPR